MCITISYGNLLSTSLYSWQWILGDDLPEWLSASVSYLRGNQEDVPGGRVRNVRGAGQAVWTSVRYPEKLSNQLGRFTRKDVMLSVTTSKCFKRPYINTCILKWYYNENKSMIWLLRSHKTIYKNPECKTRSESWGISENNIIQWLSETFGIFRWLAAELCQITFVYEVIGNMAGSNKRWRQRQFEPLKKRVLRRW